MTNSNLRRDEMRFPLIHVCILVAFTGVLTLGAGNALAHQAADGTQTVLKRIRDRIRSRDFPGAVRTLRSLDVPSRARDDVLRLELLAHLGGSMQADLSADEAYGVVHKARGLEKQWRDLRTSFPDDQFLVAVEKHVHEYSDSARKLGENAASTLIQCANEATLARALGERIEKESPVERHEEAVLARVWAELWHWAVLRDLRTISSQGTLGGFLSSVNHADLVRLLEAQDTAAASTERIVQVLMSAIGLAGRAKSPRTALAVAQALHLYCAVGGHLQKPALAYPLLRFTVLPSVEAPLPQTGIPLPTPLAQDPGVILRAENGTRLRREPEALLLPAFQRAADLDPDGVVPGLRYGWLRVLTLLNEAEAERVLERWHRQERPPSPEVQLEQARRHLLVHRDSAAALNFIDGATQTGNPQRHILSAAPDELRDLFCQTRLVVEHAPKYTLTFRPLVQLMPNNVRDSRRSGRSPLPALSQQLRLGELLTRSDHEPDVTLGVETVQSALQGLAREQLPEAQKLQVEAYRRRLTEARSRVPAYRSSMVVTREGILTPDQVPQPIKTSCFIVDRKGSTIYFQAPE